MKQYSIGLIFLILALVVVPGASAYPDKTVACDGCHANPPVSLSIATNITSITVTPGQSFNVKMDWTGGANDGATQTAVKWPTVLDNAKFGLDPIAPVSLGTNPSGTITSSLKAPTTEGLYTVRVYAATGSWGVIRKETDFKNIAVTVKAAAPASVLTSIAVTPSIKSLTVGGSQVFTASGFDQFGASMGISPAVYWTSSNNTVGTINSATGAFNALAAGTTTITAKNGSSGTVSGTAAVTVTSSLTGPGSVLTTIRISPARIRLAVGGSQVFTATAFDQFSNPFVAIVTWISSNKDVGTIDENGNFIALSSGRTTITANNGTVNGTATVRVFVQKGKNSVTSASNHDDDENEDLEELEDSE